MVLVFSPAEYAGGGGVDVCVAFLSCEWVVGGEGRGFEAGTSGFEAGVVDIAGDAEGDDDDDEDEDEPGPAGHSGDAVSLEIRLWKCGRHDRVCQLGWYEGLQDVMWCLLKELTAGCQADGQEMLWPLPELG